MGGAVPDLGLPGVGAGSIAPVTLEDVREILHVSGTDHDTRITALMQAATSFAERYQQRKYLTASCIDYLDDWPAEIIRPRWSPLVSVTSITYVDTAGVTQTWASENYVVDTDAEPGEIRLAYNKTWPATRGEANEIIVTYSAGYGAESDVPQHIRTGISLLVYDWFYHPDREGKSLPAAVAALLGMDRLMGV